MNLAIFQALANGTADLNSLRKTDLRTLLGAASAVPAATITRETAAMIPIKETLTLSSFSVTVANTTGASFGASKIYDFPAGRILILGAVADLSFNWAGQDIGATGSGDFSVGSTATADATLSSTDVNIIASSAMTDPFVAGVGAGVGSSAAAVYLDGTTTAADAYLNIIIDDADVSDAASDIVLVSGTITLYYINLGDYTAV